MRGCGQVCCLQRTSNLVVVFRMIRRYKRRVPAAIPGRELHQSMHMATAMGALSYPLASILPMAVAPPVEMPFCRRTTVCSDGQCSRAGARILVPLSPSLFFSNVMRSRAVADWRTHRHTDTQTQTQTQTCQPLGEAAKKRRDMLGQCRTHRQRASESLSAGSGDDVVR